MFVLLFVLLKNFVYFYEVTNEAFDSILSTDGIIAFHMNTEHTIIEIN